MFLTADDLFRYIGPRKPLPRIEETELHHTVEEYAEMLVDFGLLDDTLLD